MSHTLSMLYPRPQRIDPGEGEVILPLPCRMWLREAGPSVGDDMRNVAAQLSGWLADVGVDSEWTAFARPSSASWQPCIQLQLHPSMFTHDGAYRLSINEEGASILASDPAGLFYGACTLRQLLPQELADQGEDPQRLRLPRVTIVDWPALPHRGVMLDISRDRVPTLETLFGLVDRFASWKINQLQLYMEHTFAYEGHEAVWRDASPMTGHDILALDAYCRERYIELVPNQNSFGHMHRWLIHDEYRPLAECPEGIDHPFSPDREPYSICPVDAESLALLDDIYGQLLPHFRSRLFNVGLDETFDLGLGRSKDVCDAEGTSKVYLSFLRKVAEMARHHGRAIQFWADIVLKDPAWIHEIPGDAVAMIWGYEASHKFAEQCATMASVGLPFYVCPGTSSWNSFGGRTDNAVGNLRLAAREAREHGAIGYLNTDWGDFGHTQPLPVSYLGFLAGAGCAWNVDALDDVDVEGWARLLDHYVFRDDAGVVGKVVCDLGNAYKQTGARHFNASPLFRLSLLWYKHAPKDIEHITADSLAANKAYIQEAIAPLRGHMMQLEEDEAALIVEELTWVADVLCFACDFATARIHAPEQDVEAIDEGTKAALRAQLEPLIAQHRRQWLKRSRPGGLEDSVGHFARILEALGGS